MSDEYDKKRPDAAETPAPSGGNRPSGEDPLIELARIVHNNKQLGAPVSSGRVGSTDYFADLDDFASEPKPAADPYPTRQEPAFGVGQSREIPLSGDTRSNEQPRFDAPQPTSETGSYAAADVVRPSEASAPGYQSQPVAAGNVSDWPQVPQLDTIEATAASAMNRPAPSVPTPPVSESAQPAFQPSSPPEPRGAAVNIGRDFGAGLAASVANDLEQNLTAELEDELKGALRQTIDPPEVQEFGQSAAPAPNSPEPHTPSQTQSPATDSSYYSGGYQAHTASYSQTPAPARSENYPDTDTPDDTLSRTGDLGPAFGPETAPPMQAFDRPAQDIQPEGYSPSAPAPQRPAINEDDLFAALTTPQGGAVAESTPQASEDSQQSIAGIDTLLADLDFPERDDRARQQSAAENSSERAAAQTPAETTASAAGYAAEAPVPGRQTADDIDDMVWPAAADAVRDLGDDDTPPPPEGYDLDAVARAMQESDPTLKGSGVLPPHSRAEQAAVPHAEERSRRGIFVAAGVLGVAALGAAGFFFLDTDTIAVPDGPPPVISGLQEPLKIFPEEQDPSGGNNQSAKLIYDRVDGRNENAPTQLARPETPEPASLPPAPAGVQSGAELVPGATKRVRTVVVRPDGTIVSGDDAASAATGTAQPAAPAPAEPRVVATQPITATPSPEPAGTPTAPEPAAATPQPATPAPSTPAIVAAAEPTAPVEESAGPVPTVLPRKKPAAPVQVAQAPAAATNPAPATQNNGPLNLSQPASAPVTTTAPSATTAGAGSIPAGTYIVQVTSQRSASAASDAYSSLQRRYPSIIGNVNAVIVAADLGDRGVFYRARIPTGSRDEAIRLCEQLQGAGGDCFVRRQ
ncbi:SPOR domain-containing protein [Roseibium alexandrii]|uniref:Sporulation related domain protein n=1 Tax=Roseibium alexandrii TaxID=388408 RepID=A0A0M6ZPG2_9HYPH|nr:SPOR domain-containing protein [Roseibium alexandrii]CTQ64066.1 Sporulation related domain protein [Roseibium alexandrii]